MVDELDLFPEEENSIEKEWKDMPEFVQEDQTPKYQIIVSFANYDDVKAFAKLMEMSVSPNTKSTWYPHRPLKKNTQGYVAE